MARPEIGIRTPLHITLRLKDGLTGLRNRTFFREFKKAVRASRDHGLFVVHFSILKNHIHLFAEARSNKQLALGMRSLNIRLAKALKKQIEIKTNVFNGRYHIHVLKTPREVRNVLEHVLLNFPKHLKVIDHIDKFSSGISFKHWDKLLGNRFDFFKSYAFKFNEALDEVVVESQSWLGRVGWIRA